MWISDNTGFVWKLAFFPVTVTAPVLPPAIILSYASPVPHQQGQPLGYPPQGTPGAWPQGQPMGLPVQGATQ